MDPIARERARSLRSVQVIFAILALISISAALAVSSRGVEFGLPEDSSRTISLAFLFVGAVDTLLLFLWERIFERMQP
jgi:hypothetical protein